MVREDARTRCHGRAGRRAARRALSLVEVLVGVTIFVLLFTYVLRAFTPAATDEHNLIRGYTTAMNVAHWYLNTLEEGIDRACGFPTAQLGVASHVTMILLDEIGPDVALLQNLSAEATVKLAKVEGQVNNILYEIVLDIRWGNRPNDARPHRYTARRWKAKPGG